MGAERLSLAEPVLAVPVRRFVWCAAGGRMLFGRTRPAPAPRASWWRRLLGRSAPGGTIYEFEAVERERALAALAEHLRSPGAFSIETAEGARIDFLVSRGSGTVTLDCWFFAVEEVDTVVIERGAAREVVEAVFEEVRDRGVVRRIRELEGRREAA